MARVFVSYAHANAKWRDYVELHLAPLRRLHDLELWSDKQIGVGDDWAEVLDSKIADADAAIFLVSAEFLASNFIQSTEVPKILRRRQAGKFSVWPLILSPCGWKAVKWLARMQIRPENAVALSELKKPKRDKAMELFSAEVHAQIKPTGGSRDRRLLAEICIDKDLKSFSPSERDEFLRNLDQTLGDGDPIIIRRLKPGSTRIFVEMTEAQLEKLKMLLRDGLYPTSALELRGTLSEAQRLGLELFEFRDRLVMPDTVVAALFGVSVKALNQAVKRNKEKFDADYAFMLNAREWTDLRSQIVTAKSGRGGRTSPPWMFTEKGVVMSSTVLRSAQAVEAARLLVDVFVEARRSAVETRGNSFNDERARALVERLKVFDGEV